MQAFQNIPFLNGGLFEPDPLIEDSDLHVTNATFGRMFDGLLERYNFTVTEDTPLDREVAVDPEMLGKIFERLVTGRHESGAYYTPRPIVSFMCKEALKGYLADRISANANAINRFVEEHDPSGIANPEAALQALRKITVCDPACGSGAYLVGMMQELLALRQCLFAVKKVDARTDYDRKLDIIQSNLYGVDLEAIAVNIARLRLWLSLIVEYDTQPNEDPPALPNLDFKIEKADSVLAPSVTLGEELHDEQIKAFVDLKEKFLKETYNKAPLKKDIAKARADLAAWIVHDQSRASESDFDWRLDFAEVISMGENPGFDVVLANPPYVRQEIIRLIKPQLQRLYRDVYSGTADLFTYFFARAIELLRDGGQLVFICSSTWTKTASAEKLRQFLRDNTTIVRFLDFGDLPVFESVTTYPAIIMARKQTPDEKHEIQALQIKTIVPEELESELHAPAILVPQKELDGAGWRFEDRRLARLRQKIHDAGQPLKDVVDGQIYRGVLTGLNEAFVIDTETRNALIADDPACKKILKPFLEGKDLKPWRAESRGLYLIRIPAGWTNAEGGEFRTEKQAFKFLHSRYPSIAYWLKQFEVKARKRCDQGDWYWELRHCVYYSKFEQPKIMYPDITLLRRFVFDDDGFHFNNTTYFIPNANRFIQAVLYSDLLWWQLTSMVRLMRGGYLRLFSQYMEVLPIASAPAAEKKKIASLAEDLSAEAGPVPTAHFTALEGELNDRVASLYGLTNEERKIIAAAMPKTSAQPEPEVDD